ncbi:MAG: PrsW family intramembrane metalloprotease [Limnochordia bacterium]|jgi:RsiW-degrading membrane proteinase PrsW (M82 family)
MLGIIILSLGPGLLWLWYFQRFDPWDREPFALLVKTFVGGMFMVIPAILWEGLFRPWLESPPHLLATLLVTFLVVGFAEEGVKLLAVLWGAYFSSHFNEGLDGIIYAISAGLGFAAVENVFYVLGFGAGVALPRGVIAFLAHASFAGVMGYYIGRAKFSSAGGWEMAKGLAWAVFFHGLYDFILIGGILPPWTAIALVAVVFGWLLILIRRAQQASPFGPN